jgi:DUF1016 N-terminal domain
LDEETENLLRGEGMSEHIDPLFSEVVHLIQSARQRAFQAVNTALIDLYWQVGEYISRKIAGEVWGKAVIQKLAEHLRALTPTCAGSPPKISGGCGSSMKHTRRLQFSRHC